MKFGILAAFGSENAISVFYLEKWTLLAKEFSEGDILTALVLG